MASSGMCGECRLARAAREEAGRQAGAWLPGVCRFERPESFIRGHRVTPLETVPLTPVCRGKGHRARLWGQVANLYLPLPAAGGFSDAPYIPRLHFSLLEIGSGHGMKSCSVWLVGLHKVKGGKGL